MTGRLEGILAARIVVGLLSLSAIACTNEDAVLGVLMAPPAGAQVSFSQEVLPIFTQGPPSQNCSNIGCHGDIPSANLSLKPADAFNSLVGVASCEAPQLVRVNPGDSMTSYLLIKLEGLQSMVSSCVLCEGRIDCGDRMPLGAPPLDPIQIQLIRDWIDQGAQDN